MFVHVSEDYPDGFTLHSQDSFKNIVSQCTDAGAGCQFLTTLSLSESVTCNTTACMIECTEKQCVGTFISGASATSLDLHCADSACVGSLIVCPQTHGSSCRVYCEDDACEYAQIEMTSDEDISTFQLECTGRCRSLRITLSALSIQNIAIDCSEHEYACPGLDVSIAADSVNITSLSCNADEPCDSVKLTVPDGIVYIQCHSSCVVLFCLYP